MLRLLSLSLNMPFLCKRPSVVPRVLIASKCPPHNVVHDSSQYDNYYDPLYSPALQTIRRCLIVNRRYVHGFWTACEIIVFHVRRAHRRLRDFLPLNGKFLFLWKNFGLKLQIVSSTYLFFMSNLHIFLSVAYIVDCYSCLTIPLTFLIRP